ncbi:CAF17-like 4Fe-4S cluster assembly/insertion protein YgfZ [Agromyces marinus]|uniref:Folate-binding protein n=1 Tax=Agromyces marinus TaxID=1389020 RepID=A0ABN6YI54_9MICO|nr:folate-binding protein [Agromyces marinus]UIP59298.1 Aminomethyltransferase [Agromyces marinus]BDZ55681.1 folate-binding protein [Agromyces marinus]
MTGSPFLTLPGAVPAEAPDEGVAAHYGNPLVEQRRLEQGRAIVDLSHRGVVTVSGPDRLSWLNSMASRALDRLAPGESVEALFLDASGHVEHAVHALDDGERTWLVVEGGDAARALAGWLDRMRFMLRVEVADASDAHAVVAAVPRGDDLPFELPEGALAWDDPWRRVIADGYAYAPESGHAGATWRLVEAIVPRPALAGLAAQVRAGTLQAAGVLALEALRIAAWRPRFATEVDERTLPHELDWLRSAVDLNKGCYRGQETVAKVVNLGRPPRRLVMLHLDGSDTILPVPGDVVIGVKQRPEPAPGEDPERRAVGAITSAAMHHELGPIALAVVKRAVPAELELIVESHGTDVAASQVEIVPAGAGPAVEVPRLPRLGIRH